MSKYCDQASQFQLLGNRRDCTLLSKKKGWEHNVTGRLSCLANNGGKTRSHDPCSTIQKVLGRFEINSSRLGLSSHSQQHGRHAVAARCKPGGLAAEEA